MGFELLNRAFLLNQQLSEHIGSIIPIMLTFKSPCCCLLPAMLFFFPAGDIDDLDQTCLSNSAGLKEPQEKCFQIKWTTKPWASLFPKESKSCPAGEQLSLHGCDSQPPLTRQGRRGDAFMCCSKCQNLEFSPGLQIPSKRDTIKK